MTQQKNGSETKESRQTGAKHSQQATTSRATSGQPQQDSAQKRQSQPGNAKEGKKEG